jgi:hypothetical protein
MLPSVVKQPDGIAGRVTQLRYFFLDEEVFVHPVEPGRVAVVFNQLILRVRRLDHHSQQGHLFDRLAIVTSQMALFEDALGHLQPALAEGVGLDELGFRTQFIPPCLIFGLVAHCNRNHSDCQSLFDSGKLLEP